MRKILISGATGNIGLEVVRFLSSLQSNCEIIAAVRNVEKAKKLFSSNTELYLRKFDFENENTFSEAFIEVDVLFLLRPPHISEVDKIFRPLLLSAKKSGIQKLVFLSVQGAERSSIIPHNKIEKLIRELGFDYIFVRPSYFMQNLTTSLLKEIVEKRSITLPSGKAKFNWIDVKNIGEASARLILNFEKYKNQAFEITGSENKNFYEVAHLMSEILEVEINFLSLNPIYFYFKKKKEGMKSGFAFVMTLLHFLPRLEKEPIVSNNFEKLCQKKPISLEEFIKREKEVFLGSL